MTDSLAATAPSSLTLSSGTFVMVAMDSDLTTATAHVGDRFNVTVVDDVVAEGTVIIPRGTPGYGEVTFATHKGGFGKQGILGIALRYLDLNGKQIALDGRYREEGRGNDGAAAATMFAVGIFAVVVQGKTAVIPKGRKLKARTGEDIVFVPGMPPSTVAAASIIPAAMPGDRQQPATGETQPSTPR